MNTRLVISGYYGFGNAGDEAILASMVSSFRALDPAVGITVLSANPAKTRANHDVQAIGRTHLPRIAEALLGADALISGAGSLLQDVTSSRTLLYYLGIMALAQRLGKPVVVYANGIGPLRSRFGRRAVARILRRTALITVRDRQSLAELQALGLQGERPPVVLGADPALALMPPPPDRGRAILAEAGLGDGGELVIIAPRRFPGLAAVAPVLAAAADYLVRTRKARVLFLPMQSPEDDAAAALIRGRMRESAVTLHGEHYPGELLSLVGEASLLIGVRLHALIFAAVMAVPALGIAYDPKIPGFAESVGLPALGPHDLRVEDLLIQADLLLREAPKVRQDLQARVEKLRQQARLSARLTMEYLDARKEA